MITSKQKQASVSRNYDWQRSSERKTKIEMLKIQRH